MQTEVQQTLNSGEENYDLPGVFKLKELDFGTGKLFYVVQPGSVILVDELMQALQDIAMIVPLQKVVERIKAMENF